MLRLFFNLLLSLLLLAVLAAGGVVWYLLPQLPSIDVLREVRLQEPLRVYSRDGSLIAEFGEKRRNPVTIDQVPERLVQAVLAAEDDRFYQHPGVDWQGLLRAALHVARTGAKTQGGSTITMQVARNFFLSREKTYLRKLNEILLSFKIEQMLSKDEILELYLNKIFLGQRAYGVAAAAQVYYGKALDQLDLPQLAMIAGLPQAPSVLNPISNPRRAVERRNYVLGRMLRQGFITQEEFEAASQAAVSAQLHAPEVELEAPDIAEMVRAYMLERYGEDAYTEGFHVTVTVTDGLQAAANGALRQTLLDYDLRHGYRGPERRLSLPEGADEAQWAELLRGVSGVAELPPALVVAVQEQSASVYSRALGRLQLDWEALSWARPYIDENRRGPAPKTAGEVVQPGDVIRLRRVANEAGETSWRLAQIPAAAGALVALDPDDGAVLALVGGYDFRLSKFNRVTQARRQPGSAFKPFIYSAALEHGFTAASMINDAPVVYDDPGLEGKWRPGNYSGKYYGPTRLREALTHSRNLVSIRLLREVGIAETLDHLERFGFQRDRLPQSLSLALGSNVVTPLELVSGYAVLANGGYRVEPWFIQRIESHQGLVFEAEPLRVCRECDAGDSALQPVVLELDEEFGFDLPAPAPPQEDEAPRHAPRVISAQNAWIMESMMRDVVRSGTAQRARVLERNDLSGKTGTTNDWKDAWFTGFNTRIVATAWVGFDNSSPLGNRETGASAALPMWIRFMEHALHGMPEAIMQQPPGLVTVRIDPETGLLAGSGQSRAIFETFRVEEVPSRGAGSGLDIGGGDSARPEQLF